MRKCPEHDELQEVRVKLPGWDAIVDKCGDCGGVYLDNQEVRKVTQSKGLADALSKYRGLDDEGVRCPECGRAMGEEDMDGTIVDVCMFCRSAWIDGAEMDDLRGEPLDEADDTRGVIRRGLGQLARILPGQ